MLTDCLKSPGYGMKLLPVAAIYGGNASGKTNISTALNFVKHPIVVGPLPESLIPTEPSGLTLCALHSQADSDLSF